MGFCFYLMDLSEVTWPQQKNYLNYHRTYLKWIKITLSDEELHYRTCNVGVCWNFEFCEGDEFFHCLMVKVQLLIVTADIPVMAKRVVYCRCRTRDMAAEVYTATGLVVNKSCACALTVQLLLINSKVNFRIMSTWYEILLSCALPLYRRKWPENRLSVASRSELFIVSL